MQEKIEKVLATSTLHPANHTFLQMVGFLIASHVIALLLFFVLLHFVFCFILSHISVALPLLGWVYVAPSIVQPV